MAEYLKLAKPAEPRERPPAFIQTPTAGHIHRYLDLIDALDGSRIAMICGPSGIGKSAAVQNYSANKDGIRIVSCAAGESDPKSIAETLATYFRIIDSRNMTLGRRREAIVNEILYYRVETIVFDNAHHLSGLAVSWICEVAQQSGCNMAFVGNTALEAVFLENEQLEGTAIKLAISGIDKADIAALVKAYGLDRDGIPAQLDAIGHQNGHLRKVLAVIKFAEEGSANGEPSLDDIVGAIKHLGFKKGVK